MLVLLMMGRSFTTCCQLENVSPCNFLCLQMPDNEMITMKVISLQQSSCLRSVKYHWVWTHLIELVTYLCSLLTQLQMLPMGLKWSRAVNGYPGNLAPDCTEKRVIWKLKMIDEGNLSANTFEIWSLPKSYTCWYTYLVSACCTVTC